MLNYLNKLTWTNKSEEPSLKKSFLVHKQKGHLRNLHLNGIFSLLLHFSCLNENNFLQRIFLLCTTCFQIVHIVGPPLLNGSYWWEIRFIVFVLFPPDRQGPESLAHAKLITRNYVIFRQNNLTGKLKSFIRLTCQVFCIYLTRSFCPGTFSF